MRLVFQNKQTLLFLLFVGILMVLNYKVFVFGFQNDFLGVVLSLGLFFLGARNTTIKVEYPLVFIIVVFEFISYRLHTQSLHFISLCTFICLVYYSFTRKFSFVAFICLILFSSLFNKFSEHLTTEIKQTLCQGVFYTLKNIFPITKLEGVNFYIDNSIVTIDTACMGLSMFKTGLLVAAILLTIEEKKNKGFYGIVSILVFCSIVVVLNILSNFFRIILLVLLRCIEENLLHYTIGVVCFIVYQIIPMLFLLRYFKTKPISKEVMAIPVNLIFNLISIAIIFFTSLEIRNSQNVDILYQLDTRYPIKSGKWVTEEVFKMETTTQLIYVKMPSHKPLICWTGDGYKITESKKINWNNSEIWFNRMEKDKKYYKSYWWYECGQQKYTSFISVMWNKLVYNKPIRLINIVEAE